MIQPADDFISVAAKNKLLSGGKCLFDLNKSGARLQPILFGSRACTGLERRNHSFVGKAACGRWAISQNRLYLWGSYFYWMCDCIVVKEILEYDSNISMVCRWAQKLLGYHFTVFHRSNHMMRDVYTLTRRFGPLVAQYMMTAAVLNDLDKIIQPVAYDSTLDPTVNITKVSHNVSPDSVPILTCTTIASHMEINSHTYNTIVSSPLSALSSVLILLQCSALINIDAKQTSSPLNYNAADSEAVVQDLCVS